MPYFDIAFDSPDFSNHSDTIIIIFGWYGSKLRQLNRYSDIFTQRGYHVVRTIMPSKDVLGFDKWQMNYTDQLINNVLKHYNRSKINIIPFCFSNGGALVYDKLLRKIKNNNNTNYLIKGAIIDSAPGTICFSKGYLAFKATKPPIWLNILAHLFIASSLMLFPCFLFKFWRLIFLKYLETKNSFSDGISLLLTLSVTFIIHVIVLRIQKEQNNKYWNSLRYNTLSHPELYLYSKTDNLCEANNITQLIETRRSLGCEVKGVLFENSGHVRHLMDYTAEYIDSIQTFLKTCN